MKKLLWSMLCVSLLGLFACSKDDIPDDDPSGGNKKLTVAEGEILNPVFSEYGGTETIRFTATTSWKTSISETRAAADWVSVTPESGQAGDYTLTITAQPNESEADREASIKIIAGKTEVVLAVKQQQSLRSHFPLDPKEAFPDPIFRACLQTYFKQSYISEAQALEVIKINVSGEKITSLKGIEYFANLTELDCSYNQLTALDVSRNTELRKLNCEKNQLTELDVSGCTKLNELDCYSNRLTTLDVSKNTKLDMLDCDVNQLTTLDVSQNTALRWLYCSGNQLTTLDMSKNKKLLSLECNYDQLTELDVSKTDLENSPYNSVYVDKGVPLSCVMETLKTLYLKKGWGIKYINWLEVYPRNAFFISNHTEIVYVD